MNIGFVQYMRNICWKEGRWCWSALCLTILLWSEKRQLLTARDLSRTCGLQPGEFIRECIVASRDYVAFVHRAVAFEYCEVASLNAPDVCGSRVRLLLGASILPLGLPSFTAGSHAGVPA